MKEQEEDGTRRYIDIQNFQLTSELALEVVNNDLHLTTTCCKCLLLHNSVIYSNLKDNRQQNCIQSTNVLISRQAQMSFH